MITGRSSGLGIPGARRIRTVPSACAASTAAPLVTVKKVSCVSAFTARRFIFPPPDPPGGLALHTSDRDHGLAAAAARASAVFDRPPALRSTQTSAKTFPSSSPAYTASPLVSTHTHRTADFMYAFAPHRAASAPVLRFTSVTRLSALPTMTMLEFPGWKRTAVTDASSTSSAESPRSDRLHLHSFLETSWETSTDFDQCRTSPSAEEVTSSLPPADQSRSVIAAAWPRSSCANSKPPSPSFGAMSSTVPESRPSARVFSPPRPDHLATVTLDLHGVKMRFGCVWWSSMENALELDATVELDACDRPERVEASSPSVSNPETMLEILRTGMPSASSSSSAPRRNAAATTDAGLIRFGSIGTGGGFFGCASRGSSSTSASSAAIRRASLSATSAARKVA